MEIGLRRGIAAVAMNGDAGDETCSLFIAEHLDRKIDQVPIVIKSQNLGFDRCHAECRSQIVSNKVCLLFSAHPHAGVIGWNVEWFILYGYCVDGNTSCLIRLNVAHKIVGEWSVCGGQECSLDHGTRCLHPAGRAPWR